MRNKKMNIWGREFDLEVSFSCYPGEEITQIQEEALERFCEKNLAEDSLDKLKEYVISTSEETEINNIIIYVMPRCIFIPRRKEHTVALLCDYRFEMEHGIAVVYVEDELSEIGAQDIVL